MTPQEELLRLRKEAKHLRQKQATLSRSRDAQKNRADRLQKRLATEQEAAQRLNDRIKILEKENAELKNRLDISVDHAKKLAGMVFKANIKKQDSRKRGGIQGHPGHGKEKPGRVDRDVDVFLTHCQDCGNPLEQTSSVDTRIVEDIADTTPLVTRYSIERQWCRHCHKEVRAIPKSTIPGMRFGLNVIILITHLKYRLRTPLERMSELLQTQYHLSITDSGIQEILHTIKTTFTAQYKTILQEIRNAPMKHADETSFRIDGMNGYCWLFATPSAALYTIENTRGKGVPERILGHDPTGVLVRDDYPGYQSLPMPQQSCWAHLLRVSHESSVHDGASEEMHTLHTELKTLFVELDAVTTEPFDQTVRTQKHRRYAKRITRIIQQSYQYPDAQAVQTRIANQNTNLITALLYEHVPLTNNHAERMIRPMVITRKISGGARSERGAATHAVNMSIMQTLALQGIDFSQGIRDIISAGDPRYALGNGG